MSGIVYYGTDVPDSMYTVADTVDDVMRLLVNKHHVLVIGEGSLDILDHLDKHLEDSGINVLCIDYLGGEDEDVYNRCVDLMARATLNGLSIAPDMLKVDVLCMCLLAIVQSIHETGSHYRGFKAVSTIMRAITLFIERTYNERD